MTRNRSLTAALLVAMEAAAVLTLLSVAASPASAQLFNERFPFQNRRVQPAPRGPFDWFYNPQPQYEEPRAAPAPAPPPVDYSKAPASKKPEPKTDTAGLNAIMVFGDSMADWLAYGLEQAYADAPEMGVLRRHRTNSGLIRTENRNDPRGEYPDWPQAAREMIAAQQPKFVLMMIGTNDRRSIRETAPVVARNVKPAPARPDDPAALELDKAAPDQPADNAAGQPATAPSASTPPAGNRTLEFRSDAWSDAYIRRIDDTLAALKTSGVPVFWVGLPPLRGQKASADISFLNDLYRSRADKAGIIFIDVWDGFVDEDGRYAQSGPDYEGQIRRLRTGDGVHFTQAGARKLAHYAEREIQRWLNAQPAEVAVPIQEEPKAEPAVARSAAAPAAAGGHARPLAGPIVPLTAERSGESDDQLLGASGRGTNADAMVTKVLVKGEAVRAPAGRADDFAWPRRDIAPLGSDPVVAMTDLPMTPMLAEKSRSAPAATASASAATTPGTVVASAPPPRPRRVAPRATAENQESYYRPDYYRRQPTFFPFQSLFGGRW